jgi:hypothetical protein
MGNLAAKEVQKSGITITKDRLIEMIRKSTQQSFMISQSQTEKTSVVVIKF